MVDKFLKYTYYTGLTLFFVSLALCLLSIIGACASLGLSMMGIIHVAAGYQTMWWFVGVATISLPITIISVVMGGIAHDIANDSQSSGWL